MRDYSFGIKMAAIFIGAIAISLAFLSITGPEHRDNCVGCCK